MQAQHWYCRIGNFATFSCKWSSVFGAYSAGESTLVRSTSLLPKKRATRQSAFLGTQARSGLSCVCPGPAVDNVQVINWNLSSKWGLQVINWDLHVIRPARHKLAACHQMGPARLEPIIKLGLAPLHIIKWDLSSSGTCHQVGPAWDIVELIDWE